MKVLIPSLALTLFTIAANTNAQAQVQPLEIDAYDSCISIAQDSPIAGLEMANSLIDSGAEASGTHCQAVALFADGQAQKAANLFDQLASDAPDELRRAKLLIQAASALVDADQQRQALDRATQATELDPTNAQPWLIIADVQGARESFAEAISALQFAEALLPSDQQTDLLVSKASLLRRADRVDASRDALIEALQTEPSHPGALLELGVLFFELGDDPNAALVWGDLIDLHAAAPEALQARRYLKRLQELQSQ